MNILINNNTLRIGVDLGGTKIEVVALADDSVELLRRRVPTPREDYPGTLATVAGLVKQAEDQLGRNATVGFGIPGAESPSTGLIKNANSTWLIGQTLRRDLQTLLQRDHARVNAELLDATQIAVRAANGDARCESTLCRYEERLARALAQVVNILDPDAIVLGGGLSNLDRLYESVPRLWRADVFSDQVTTRFEKNRHGDASGVRGAAWLW